jgi:predicted metal-dependent peptidase
MSKPTKQKKKCLCESSDYEYLNIFGAGSLADTHLDILVSEEEIARDMQEALENAKKMGGLIGSGFIQDLAKLSAPKMMWEDFVAVHIGNKKDGVGRNDWGRPRTRPLFYGMFLPRKRAIHFSVLILIDRSGSVTNEQANHGISQIQVLENNIEGYILCFDTVPYYDKIVKIDDGSANSLLKVEYVGGGGTQICSSLYSYEEMIGEVDMVITITDGGIMDLADMNKKGAPNGNTQYLWLLTEYCPEFKPEFGRVFRLNNDL